MIATLEKSQTSTQATIGRDFAAAFRSVRCNLPQHMMNEPESAKREYSICVAALDCRIDPRDVCAGGVSADLLCFISQSTDKMGAL